MVRMMSVVVVVVVVVVVAKTKNGGESETRSNMKRRFLLLAVLHVLLYTYNMLRTFDRLSYIIYTQFYFLSPVFEAIVYSVDLPTTKPIQQCNELPFVFGARHICVYILTFSFVVCCICCVASNFPQFRGGGGGGRVGLE